MNKKIIITVLFTLVNRQKYAQTCRLIDKNGKEFLNKKRHGNHDGDL